MRHCPYSAVVPGKRLAVGSGRVAEVTLTYPFVGATRDGGPLPDGYHAVHRTADLGQGDGVFTAAAAALRSWEMHRGAGLRVRASGPVAVGVRADQRLGPIHAPCEVVWVVDEPNRWGFGYGTLPGHPESGEESFVVARDPASDVVRVEVGSISRPVAWYVRLAGPLGRVVQEYAMRRYIAALRRLVRRSDDPRLG